MTQRYTPPTDAEFSAASVVIRARSQIARLQAVIDYGEGDVARAEKIRDILEGSVAHCRKYEAGDAIRGNPSQLGMTLREWAPAINSVCRDIENVERVS